MIVRLTPGEGGDGDDGDGFVGADDLHNMTMQTFVGHGSIHFV